MATFSNEELIEGLKSGCEESFNQVFEAFHFRLYGFLLRLSGNADLATDLTQETWLRLVRAARGLEANTSIFAWLITVARNLYISHYRSTLTEFEKWQRWKHPGPQPVHPPSPSPLEEAVAHETLDDIEQAFKDLPIHYREVLLLVAVEGLSAKEVGRICGLRTATVRQRLHRARQHLLKQLKQAGKRNCALNAPPKCFG